MTPLTMEYLLADAQFQPDSCFWYNPDVVNPCSGFIINPCPQSGEILNLSSGNFTTGPYGDDWFCTWIIAPPNASLVTLSFSSFVTQAPAFGTLGDWAFIFECTDITCSEVEILGKFAGTMSQIPYSITSTTGIMRVQFYSDPTWAFNGFVASYTAPCPPGSYGPVLGQCKPSRSRCPAGKALDVSAYRSYGTIYDAGCLCPAGQYSDTIDSPCKQCPGTCKNGAPNAQFRPD